MRSLYLAIIGFTLAIYAPCLGSTGQLTPYRFGPRESELLANGEVVVQVNQSEEGSKGTIRAAIVVDAPAEQIWNALTDCDHTPEFIPRLQSCKVLQHGKDMEIIEHQVNISWFLPSFTYTYRVSYDRFKRIDFKRIGGDLKEIEGSWVLEQEYTLSIWTRDSLSRSGWSGSSYDMTFLISYYPYAVTWLKRLINREVYTKDPPMPGDTIRGGFDSQ
jgi:hypothetical protein